MSLNRFITHIKQIGLIGSSKFEVIVPVIDGASTTSSSTVSLMCSAASVPGQTVMTNELRYFGEATERPHGISYAPVSLTFYIDNDLSAKRYFDTWTNLVFNKSTRELGYYDTYTRDIEIVVYNKDEKEVDRIKLYEAYPKSISELPLDFNQNSTMILTVQLVYKWWESSKQDSWKGANGAQEVPSNEFTQFGLGGQAPQFEGLGNDTFNTFAGQGIFNNPTTPFLSTDASTAFLQAGTNILTDSTRGLTQAGNLFGISGITSGSIPSIGEAFSGNSSQMLGSFTGFANGLSSLGNNLNNITSPVNQIATNLGGMSTAIGSFGHLVGALGGNTNEFSKIAGQLAQTAGYMSTVSQLNGLPGYLNSAAANMSSMGAMVSDSIGLLKNNVPSFDRTAEIAFNNTSNTFFNSSSILSQATSILSEK